MRSNKQQRTGRQSGSRWRDGGKKVCCVCHIFMALPRADPSLWVIRQRSVCLSVLCTTRDLINYFPLNPDLITHVCIWCLPEWRDSLPDIGCAEGTRHTWFAMSISIQHWRDSSISLVSMINVIMLMKVDRSIRSTFSGLSERGIRKLRFCCRRHWPCLCPELLSLSSSSPSTKALRSSVERCCNWQKKRLGFEPDLTAISFSSSPRDDEDMPLDEDGGGKCVIC